MTDEIRQSNSPERSGADAPMQPASTPEAGEGLRSAAVLDPAQESLASALKLTFRFVQFVMILLVAAFLVSGFQTVGETERGIKLTFGKVTRQDLQPGVQWSWPFPFGELLKVRTSQESVDLGDFFMPRLSSSQRSRPWSKVTQRKVMLKPGEDGSIITADGALAHLECSVTYHRDDPVANAKNVYTADEVQIVRTAVERGVVSTVAEMTIDQLLRQGGSGGAGVGSLDENIRRSAQAALDAIGSGIRIDSVNVRDPRPPLAVFKEFDAVAKAEAEAAKGRENASRAYRITLNDAAGEAHEILLDRLDAYERAIDLGDRVQADAVLAQIDALLEGSPVQIDGVEYKELTSGRVTLILNDARQYRTDVVAQARTKVETFHAKLVQFRKEPALLVTTEWSRAYRDFLDNGQYETILLPGDSTARIILTPDPDIPKQIEAERNKKQAEKTIKGREKFIRERFDERMERERRQARQQKSGG